MKPIFRFMNGLWSMPLWVRIWVAILFVANTLVPPLFWDHPESKVIFGTIMASAVLMMLLHALQGFTRLLGLAHFLWFPLLWYLMTRVPETPGNGWFGVWIRGVMILNGLSLVMDVADVVRWIAGDRDEVVSA